MSQLGKAFSGSGVSIGVTYRCVKCWFVELLKSDRFITIFVRLMFSVYIINISTKIHYNSNLYVIVIVRINNESIQPWN